jgi:hypothetical protein
VGLSVQRKNKPLISHVRLISIYRRTLLITGYYIRNHVHSFEDKPTNVCNDVHVILL